MKGGIGVREKIISQVQKLYHYSFVRVVRQTLLTIFPIVFVGTIAQMFLKTVFEPAGFIYNIADLYGTIPQSVLRVIQFMLASVSQLTLNVIGIYTVYLAASFTAKIYHRNDRLAGLTGVLTLLVMAYRYGKVPSVPGGFYRRLLGGNSLLLVLVIGYLVGQLYRWLTPVTDETKSWPALQERVFNAVKPITVTVGGALLVALLLNSYPLYHAWATTYSGLVVVAQEHRQLWLTVLASIAITAMEWLGLGVPYSYTVMTNGVSFTANLNYALTHGSAWGVPYKYLGSSLYNSFANFGGDGLVLALIVAILLTSNGSSMQRVARWTALSTLFNFNYATMIGLPIIFNPLLMIPFIFLPVVNILIASLAIAVHMIPSTPYPVLQGTPGPLIAFLGTNGNWGILLFTIILLLVDIMAYIPFVKLALAVEDRLRHEKGGDKQ